MTEHGVRAALDAAAVDDLAAHPAVRAWLSVADGVPRDIVVLERNDKSVIYRLVGAGPDGRGVVAKHCRHDGERVEQLVYERVLPRLPVSALRYHGCVDGDAWYWLFMEDAGDERCRLDQPDDATHMARWLAAVHAASPSVLASVPLPDSGPARFRDHATRAHAAIRRRMDGPPLTPAERAVLDDVLALLDAVEARWGTVERLCRDMPRVLVHGDLNAKNLGVRHVDGERVLLPFDWETAGWGVAAVDLAWMRKTTSLAAVEAYHDAMRAARPHLTVDEVCRDADVGVVLRLLAAITWETERLAQAWVGRAIRRLQGYRESLSRAMHVLD